MNDKNEDKKNSLAGVLDYSCVWVGHILADRDDASFTVLYKDQIFHRSP